GQGAARPRPGPDRPALVRTEARRPGRRGHRTAQARLSQQPLARLRQQARTLITIWTDRDASVVIPTTMIRSTRPRTSLAHGPSTDDFLRSGQGPDVGL